MKRSIEQALELETNKKQKLNFELSSPLNDKDDEDYRELSRFFEDEEFHTTTVGQNVDFSNIDETLEVVDDLSDLSDFADMSSSEAKNSKQIDSDIEQYWPLEQDPKVNHFAMLNAPFDESKANAASESNMAKSSDSKNQCSEVPDLEFDNYFDYTSCTSEDEAGSATPTSSPPICKPAEYRQHPFYYYRDRLEQEIPWLSDISLKSGDVLAAWSSVAPGIDPEAKSAFIKNVVIAAASINSTSLANGRARETMAPAPFLIYENDNENDRD